MPLGNHVVLDSKDNINNDSNFIGNINHFRYRGSYYDRETGLYYLNKRYYDPELKRFISEDSTNYVDKNNAYGVDGLKRMFLLLTNLEN